MNLIVDVGNSFIKVAVFKEDTVLEVFKIDQEVFFEKTSNIFEKYPSIQAIMVSSVGKLSEKQIQALAVFAPTYVLDANSKLPFKNNYATPSTLGVDRMALVAAACYKYPKKNCLIIDAGTCITYDFLTEEGVYKGGAISPGVQMRFKAMHEFTAKLPLIETYEVNDFVGSTTQECMVSGVLYGIINEIEATILQYQRKFKNLTVIFTGGDSHFLSKRLKSTIFAHPYFLLEGVNYILKLNKH